MTNSVHIDFNSLFSKLFDYFNALMYSRFFDLSITFRICGFTYNLENVKLRSFKLRNFFSVIVILI